MSFELSDYRDYIKILLEKRPRKGRGELLKISAHLRIHSTLMSQVMSGSRELTEEQGFDLADYFELSDTESEYLLLLIKISRASTERFKKHLQQKLQQFKTDIKKVSKRYTKEHDPSDLEKATFYSSWIYSAIRLYCSTSVSGKTLEDIIEYFNLPRTKALEHIQFLVRARLCDQVDDYYFMGQQRTYVDRGSIYFLKHHANWRMKSILKSEIATDQEKYYTVTMSVSQKDYLEIKNRIENLIQDIIKITADTDADQVVCFNCDLFKV